MEGQLVQLTQQDHPAVETRIDPMTGRTVEIRPAVGDFDQPTEVVTPSEARQGRLGWPVLMVLVAGLILGAVYVLGTTFWAVDENLPRSGEVAPVAEAAPPAGAPAAAPPAVQAPAPGVVGAAPAPPAPAP
jgi:hypothetical protein